MGYFDALTSGSFKTTPDGRRLFFPWGAMGRGYVIPTEEDYARLHRAVKTYTIVGLTIVIVAAATLPILWALAVATVLIVFYLAWLPSLRRGLALSDERLTVGESMATQARTHSAWVLWLMLVMSLLLVVGAVAMLVLDPGEWLTAVAGIVLFGAAAVAFIRMLLLRRRSGP